MTVLGIDYGERRIGVAISDKEDSIAMPLVTHERHGEEGDMARLTEIARTNEADTIVVGLPVNMNGTEGPSAASARAFAARLSQASGLPVEMFDERLSSVSADDSMIQAGLSRAGRKKRLDKVAAQMILQAYLDAHGPL